MFTYQQRAWFHAITENTGTHMLDSGGAMGRHWQRNRLLTIEDAYNWTHRLDVQSYGWDVQINVLHYLTSNYVIDRPRTSRFHRFAHSGKMRREDWWTCLEEWVKETGGEMGRGDNTYNHENWLSQEVLTHSFWDAEGEEWEAVQTHNGADVRGGYSKPFLCRASDTEYEVWMTDGWLGCENGHSLYADGASHWILNEPYRSMHWEEIKVRNNGKAYWLACPECNKKLTL